MAARPWNKPDPAPTGAFEHDPPTEDQKVEGWRTQVLVEAGMAHTDAAIIAALPNWREALDLLQDGCPSSLAFEIVR